MDAHGSAPILAHVITGPLGVGKTTVIARLLARKPPQQNWVVLLNEFTEAGIDTLTVASSARGAFDVRLVAGGCLCCVGEADFRRNLRELVDHVRPARILVEPSGIGHPAGIVEELLGHQALGALRLASVIALIDPPRLHEHAKQPSGVMADQLGVADGIALTRGDAASADDLQQFAQLVADCFPPMRWAGVIDHGELPDAALDLQPADSGADGAGRALRRPDEHMAHRVATATNSSAQREDDADVVIALGHSGSHWVFPRDIEFSLARLSAALSTSADGLPGGDQLLRIKGVFRVGEDHWVLAQRVGNRVDLRDTSWRRDSRAEVLLRGQSPEARSAWSAIWADCHQSRAACIDEA